ncbi:MAG TPA: T9SS type A sorting domain-containing protein, partial [Ignavibacteria bacterium]|nr:T9SS type A sorting domain-containing protein [Ignavibacteria bacterium]
GGENWTSVFTGGGYQFSMQFTDLLNGHLCGTAGSYLRTTNGGETWFKPMPITGNDLYSIQFTDANTGYIVGTNGTILKTTNGGLTGFNSNTGNTGVPLSFYLQQNYPNPFNPETVIKFSLPNSGNVLLKVFDASGRELKTITDKYMNKGEYEFTLDLGNVSSGVYFYQIVTDEFTETKKMVLIK